MKMKKLVALGAAAAMSMTMCVNVFAADPIVEDITEGTEVVGKQISFLVGDNGADISVSTEAQITVMAYLINAKDENGTAYTVETAPEVTDASQIVAIDQAGGSAGFAEIPVDANKLAEGKVMVVKLGGSDGSVEKFLVVYNEETKTVDIIIGDVDGDGNITAKDGNLIKAYVKALSSTAKKNYNTTNNSEIGVAETEKDGITIHIKGDVDGDGNITAKDGNLIKAYVKALSSTAKKNYNTTNNSKIGNKLTVLEK